MGIYYPQGVMTFTVILEDYGEGTPKLEDAYVFSAIAKTITVNRNSYREADTFSCEFDFKAFPFDPRAIRAAQVTIHIEDRKQMYDSGNSLNRIRPTDKSIVFQGYVDKDTIDLSEDSRTVVMEGRDFTSLLIDRPYFGAPIAMSKPLDEVIQDLLNSIEETKFEGKNSGIEVVNKTGVTPLPILSKLAPGFNKEEGKKNSKPRKTYWDMIQGMISTSGLIAYIEIDKLVISKPRTLFNRDKKKLFAFGSNVKSMSLERKLGRQKGINIKVVAFISKDKKVETVLIPEEASDEWLKDIGLKKQRVQTPTIKSNGEKGEPKDAPFLTFRVRDIASVDHLRSVGEGIYEEVGRQQLEGTLTTKEMILCEDNGTDKTPLPFPAVDLKIGTPIDIDINNIDLRGMPNLKNIGSEKNRKNRIKSFLETQCYSPEVASIFAETLSKFDTAFYTKSFEMTLDQESGFTLNVDFINFINLPQNLAGK